MPQEYARLGSITSQQQQVLETLQAITTRLDALEGREAPTPAPEPKQKKRGWAEELLRTRDHEVDKANIQHQVDELIVMRKYKKLDRLLGQIPQDFRLQMIGATRCKLVTTDFRTGKPKTGLDDADVATMKVLHKWGAPCVVHQQVQEVVEAP